MCWLMRPIKKSLLPETPVAENNRVHKETRVSLLEAWTKRWHGSGHGLSSRSEQFPVTPKTVRTRQKSLGRWLCSGARPQRGRTKPRLTRKSRKGIGIFQRKLETWPARRARRRRRGRSCHPRSPARGASRRRRGLLRTLPTADRNPAIGGHCR